MSSTEENELFDLLEQFSTSPETRDLFYSWASSAQENTSFSAFLILLDLIPVSYDAGCMSLACLAYLLSRHANGSQVVFNILRRYTQLWHALPEPCKSGQDEYAAPILLDALVNTKASIGDFPSLFQSTSDLPAISDPNIQKSLSHRQLSSFIQDFNLPISFFRTDFKPVVVIALPNGHLLGLACLAVSCYYIAAPVNTSGGSRQFRSDVELVRPHAVLVLEADCDKLGLLEPWVAEAGIQILLLKPNTDMTFQTRLLEESETLETSAAKPNVADDIAFLLLTSGTTGMKKIVPITCFSLLTGVTCVVDSWGLTSQDSCLNMMPLNHVGGLVRNLFAPILCGGSTILCPVFDPNLFWDIIQDGGGTWYYASPSMHMAILDESNSRSSALSQSRIRLVCNAAGGLLPALAGRLKGIFGCTVLPSYGMTECMPISTPPLNYTLDRAGTSGIPCGPEIAIFDDSEVAVASGQVGRICVRGGPTFLGYLEGGKIDRSALSKDGWFDTGDLGTLDGDHYLYLTGRAKEVINRGGELISPFEVEEAIMIASQDSKSPLFQRVVQVMAFSVPDDRLQEVVGVALVTPPFRPRPDVRELHTALRSSLHSSKLPVVVVYIDALPTSNNKIVRIKFGERLDLDSLRENMTLAERHFEAVCPPVNSALSTKITKRTCLSDLSLVAATVQRILDIRLDVYVREMHDGTSEMFLAPKYGTDDILFITEIIESLRLHLKGILDGYLIPSKITYLENAFPREPSGFIDEIALQSQLQELQHSHGSTSNSENEMKIRHAFADILSCSIDEISSESDFFYSGGDSLSAGRLLSILRHDLDVQIPVEKLFAASRVCDLHACVESILAEQSKAKAKALGTEAQPLPGCTETYSSTNPLVLFVHLLPIILFYPMKSALQWTVLMYSLSSISLLWSEPNVAARFLALVAAMFISRAATQIITPLFGITFKWMIMGSYKEGLYPMWGPYHTRWWIVQKVLIICGKGFFRHFDATRLIYYRLLGAKIGKGVTIERGTTLGEYDLLEIGDNVHLNRCICRPFATERNTSMYLGKIVVGKNSSVGLKAHIAAGSVLPEDTFVGPNSSSYEMDDEDDFHNTRTMLPKPHLLMKIFCIIPIQVLVLFISSLPWMAGLFGVVSGESRQEIDSVRTVITWWATSRRIKFHYLAQSLNISVKPFVWFGLVVLIKRVVDKLCGPSRPVSAENRTQKDNFRVFLLSALIPNGGLKRLTKLFGSHYQFTSIAVRAMGGKVGRRVYWPGTGPTIQDFNLIDIGDDVIFGSRSHINNSDAFGSDYVRIGNGAMIADRVVLSPGAVVREGTVLGSGAFIRRNQTCAPDSIWVGNRKGSAVCLSPNTLVPPSTINVSESERDAKWSSFDITALSDTTVSRRTPLFQRFASVGSLGNTVFSDDRSVTPFKPSASRDGPSVSDSKYSSPFGRAFYEGKAPYYVLNQFTIFLYSTIITILVQLYWNVGTISTIMFSQLVNHTILFHPHWYRPFKIYAFNTALLSALYITLSIIAVSIVVAAKWALLGRRKPGRYDWDKSSYCQRWQLFLTIEALRRRCFGGNGILGMLTGTHFCVLYFRAMGAKIGKDCAIFAGGRPSLIFTEPDLLTLGDRVTTDDASLVCHINSRGNFSLNTLSVGNRSVLRSGSRLLSGATMGEDVALLEHTLIMAGDVADDGLTYQGWPAGIFRGDRLRIRSRRSREKSKSK